MTIEKKELSEEQFRRYRAQPREIVKRLFLGVTRLIVGCLFREVHVRGLHHLKADGQVLLISNHQSHFDYLVTCLVIQAHHPKVLVACGDNLSYFPLGFIFRSTYAFFIPRSFSNLDQKSIDRFNLYLAELIKDEIPIGFYIEGGRSRTGQLRPPRSGFLEMCLRGMIDSEKKGLKIVPLAISYDQPFEAEGLLTETFKKKESVLHILQGFARIFFFPRFDAYINIGEAIDVRANQVGSVSDFAKGLSNQVFDRITELMPLTVGGFLWNMLKEKSYSLKDLVSAFEEFQQAAQPLNDPLGQMKISPTSRMLTLVHELERFQFLKVRGMGVTLTPRGEFLLAYAGRALQPKYDEYTRKLANGKEKMHVVRG